MLRYVYLELFNRYANVRATYTDCYPTISSGSYVVVGVTTAHPVLRIGHLLIRLRADHNSATILTGRTHGNCIYLGAGLTVAPVLFTNSNLGSSDSIEIYDCKRRSRIPRGNSARTIDALCHYVTSSLHTCDGNLLPEPASGRRAWFIQVPYILYMKSDRDPHLDWIKCYAFDKMVRKARKYFDRRVTILNHILGSKVKVLGDKTLSDLRFRNKTGKIVCTIPHIHLLTRGTGQLKAVIVQFDEDVGGSSIDGKYRKGSCLVVPPGKLDKVRN